MVKGEWSMSRQLNHIRFEHEGFKYKVDVKFYPGCSGTYLDPPEQPEILDWNYSQNELPNKRIYDRDSFYETMMDACIKKCEELDENGGE